MIARPLDQSVGRTIDHPIHGSPGQPINRSTDRPVGRSVARSLDRPVDRPVDRTSGRSVGRSASQLRLWARPPDHQMPKSLPGIGRRNPLRSDSDWRERIFQFVLSTSPQILTVLGMVASTVRPNVWGPGAVLATRTAAKMVTWAGLPVKF